MTFQRHPKTTIVKEYPRPEGEPYYPMPTKEAEEIYKRYQKEASSLKSVYFIGRLAEYRYYNMDQAVKRALELFQSLCS